MLWRSVAPRQRSSASKTQALSLRRTPATSSAMPSGRSKVKKSLRRNPNAQRATLVKFDASLGSVVVRAVGEVAAAVWKVWSPSALQEQSKACGLRANFTTSKRIHRARAQITRCDVWSAGVFVKHISVSHERTINVLATSDIWSACSINPTLTSSTEQ